MPYLGVDEQATYIDVFCDGYDIRLWTRQLDTGAYLQIFTAGTTTEIAKNNPKVSFDDGGGVGIWQFMTDPNRTTFIVENTPSRVVIKAVGNLVERYTNSPELPNSTSVTMTFTILDDRIFQDIVWELSGTVTLPNAVDANGIVLGVENSFMTSESNFHRTTTGAELTGQTYDTLTSFDTAYRYLGVNATEMTVVFIPIYESTPSTEAVFGTVWGSGQLYCGYNNVILTAGTYKIVSCLLLDNVARSGGVKLYDTAAKRLAFYDQFKTQTLPIYEGDGVTAAEITDFNTPASIGSNGFRSDGAWAFDVDASQQAKFTADIDRDNMSLVIPQSANLGIQTVTDASTKAQHQLFLWPCESTATTVGPTGTNNGAATFTVSGTRGNCLDTLGTADISFAVAVSDYFDDDAFTIICDLNLQTSPSANAHIFGYGNATDYVRFGVTSADLPFLTVVRGSTSVTVTGTTALTVGSWVTLKASCSSSGFMTISVKGQVEDTAFHTGTLTSVATGTMYFGADEAGANNIDALLDNCKIFDTNVLEFGAFYVGIGSDSADFTAVNTDVAHSDVLFYMNCSQVNGDTVDIGSVTVTQTNIGTPIAGPDGGNTIYVDTTASNECSFPVNTTNGLIDFSKGTIAFWFKAVTSITSTFLFAHTETWNYFELKRDALNNTLTFAINSSQIGFGIANIWDGNWHFIEAHWDTNLRYLVVDGLKNANNTTAYTTPTAVAGNIRLGQRRDSANDVDGHFRNFYITNNPNTPQLWTANYKPTCLPILDKV